jgi:hypothetical protein
LKDPRYDAVGSSSLREELFTAFLKVKSTDLAVENPSSNEKASTQSQNPHETKQERKERAVREREQKVKAELQLIEGRIDKSRTQLNREEGELEFKYSFIFSFMTPNNTDSLRTLLTDAVRDPQV